MYGFIPMCRCEIDVKLSPPGLNPIYNCIKSISILLFYSLWNIIQLEGNGFMNIYINRESICCLLFHGSFITKK